MSSIYRPPRASELTRLAPELGPGNGGSSPFPPNRRKTTEGKTGSTSNDRPGVRAVGFSCLAGPVPSRALTFEVFRIARTS